MTNYLKMASSDIRRFIWDQILSFDILNENDYYADGFVDALVPIIPSQQVPEFNNLLPGKTYLIYDFEVKQVPVQWWMTEESMTISIMSQNYDVVNELSNLLHDLFRRYDESATDINGYFEGESGFLYHHISIDSIMSPEPYSAEGDYVIGSVTFTYSYSRITGANGRF